MWGVRCFMLFFKDVLCLHNFFILVKTNSTKCTDHFQALLMAKLLSMSFFITFATDISKSSCVTWILLSLKANIPASVHTAFDSAPDAPFICSAIFFKSIPLIKFIFLEWIFKISSLDSMFGLGNSIFLSILPGLKSAGSRMSILFVAMMILIVWVVSKPSNWFNNSNIVLCTSESPLCPSILDPPIESTSSMKMMHGECCLAMTKS